MPNVCLTWLVLLDELGWFWWMNLAGFGFDVSLLGRSMYVPLLFAESCLSHSNLQHDRSSWSQSVSQGC